MLIGVRRMLAHYYLKAYKGILKFELHYFKVALGNHKYTKKI